MRQPCICALAFAAVPAHAEEFLAPLDLFRTETEHHIPTQYEEVTINLAALEQPSMTITVLGRTLEVTHEETVVTGEDEFVYAGSTPGSKYDVLIAVSGGVARMEVAGLHNLVMMPSDLDHRAFPSRAFTMAHEARGDDLDFNPDHASIVAGAPGHTFDHDDYRTIPVNMFFIYTDGAFDQANYTTIRNTANLGVSSFNYALTGSHIPLQLVHANSMTKATYEESGSLETDLQRLITPGDGHMERELFKFDDVDADIGVLMVHSPDVPECGLASQILADKENAFVAVNLREECLKLNMGNVIAHEVGHLFGARHDWDADNSTVPFPYGHGYHYERQWSTLMTYPCINMKPDYNLTKAEKMAQENGTKGSDPYDCKWDRAFSDPHETIFGLDRPVPSGTEDRADNARVMTEMGPYIASFDGPYWTYIFDHILDAPPHVVATSSVDDYAVSGDTVTLDASESSDVDSEHLSFSWVQAKNGAPLARIDGANSAVASFVVPYSDELVAVDPEFIVTVSDGGSFSKATVAVSALFTSDPRITGYPFSLYLANEDDNNILAFTPDGDYIREVASTGTSGDSQPFALAFGPEGTLHVGYRNGTITKFSDDGTRLGALAHADRPYDMEFRGTDLFVWGEGGVQRVSDKGAVTSAGPAGTGYRGGTFGADGKLYALHGSSVRIYDGSDYEGAIDLRDGRGSRISPYSMAFHGDGTFLVTSHEPDGVFRYDQSGALLEHHDDDDISHDPTGITLAPDGRFYVVTDRERIARLSHTPSGFEVLIIADRSTEELHDPADVAAGPTVLPADSTPPVIEAPADVTINATNATTPVSAPQLGRPAVADSVDPMPSVSNDAPAEFPLGTTTVIWTATDASGNSASAAQLVTLVDVVTVAAPPDPHVEATGRLTHVPEGTLGVPDASSAAGSTVEVSHDSPGIFPLGTTDVTWTASYAGGKATAVQKVTVTAPPGLDPDVIIAEDFEGGLGWFAKHKGRWMDTGALAQPPGAEDGNRVARAEDCPPVCSIRTAVPVDLSGYGGVVLEFDRFISKDLGGRDRLTVQAYDGSRWQNLAQWRASDGHADSQWHRESIPLGPGHLVPEAGLRIWTHNHGPAKRVLLDNVSLVSGTADFGISAPPDHAAEASGAFTYLPPHVLGAARVSGAAPATSDAPAVFLPGTTDVTWTAADPSGRTASVVQQVTVTAPPGLDPGIILHEDFEDGLGWFAKMRGLWKAGTTLTTPPGEDAGNRAARTSYCGKVCALKLAHPVDLSGHGGAVLELDRFVSKRLDDGEGLFVQINSGSGWQGLAAWGASDGHADSQWHRESLPLGPEHMEPEVMLRIWAKAGGYNEKVFIDNVTIRAGAG